MTEEFSKIDWPLFESRYWRPEKGKSHEVVLANWRQKFESFDNEKTEKPVIVFDVLNIDGEEIAANPKLFSTGAHSFAEKARPIIERAEQEGKRAIKVYLEYTDDKRYNLFDLERLRGK